MYRDRQHGPGKVARFGRGCVLTSRSGRCTDRPCFRRSSSPGVRLLVGDCSGNRCDHPGKMVVYHTNEVPLRPAHAGNASHKCIAKAKRRRWIGEVVSTLPTQGLQQTRSSCVFGHNEREHREEQPWTIVLMETVSPSAQATMAGSPARGQPDGSLRNIFQQLDELTDAAAQAPETTWEPTLLPARGNLRGVARYGKAVRR